MANTIDWGKGAVENTIEWGQGASDNTINWGKSQTLSPSGETNITGSGGTPAFANTKSILLDSSNSDFVTMGNVSSLDFDITDAFSISAWIKSNGSGQMDIASKALNAFNKNKGYQFYETDGKLIFIMTPNINSFGKLQIRTGNEITDNTWHHVAVTYNGNGLNAGLNLYVNGASPTVVRSGTLTLSVANTSEFNLGARANSEVFWNGNLDEVSVFNLELSASDITTIYGTGVPNDISGLSPLSWWRCGDGDTSPTLTDNGSGGNNGTMTNFTTFSTDVPT